jgi:Holliday junction resolvase-like predicted endonuclease
MNEHYYDTLFSAAREKGLTVSAAAEEAAMAFLDGKPMGQGKKKWSGKDRHTAFWNSAFLKNLSADVWIQDPVRLALTKYLGQDRFACPDLVALVAAIAPNALVWAARHSGLVMRQHSPRWLEICALDTYQREALAELKSVFFIFREAHQVRLDEVSRIRNSLRELAPLDLLIYASLFAFEHKIPSLLDGKVHSETPDAQEVWEAIDDILAWKLANCDESDLQLTEISISSSLRRHLIPFLFPSTERPRQDCYQAFIALLGAQIELNAFINRSADAFSYDDSIRFERIGDRLEIVEVDANAREAWHRNGKKFDLLQQYWLYRGMDALLASPELLERVSPANPEANLQALAKAMGTWLRLQEVYGMAEQVRTDTGSSVALFHVLMASELMTAFFIEDYLKPYHHYLSGTGNAFLSMGKLAFGGLLQPDMQNRFPITWSDKAAKVDRIKPWTATVEHPNGSSQSAEAILDFMTCDWIAVAKQLRSGDIALRPRWQERPLFKMGRLSLQLPWMMAVQNNSIAVINNLRRLGARRNETKEETRRIEEQLGALFKERGFQVLVGYEVLPLAAEDVNAGEIDLICARDGHVLILELKSTYQRRSMKEAWAHRTSTLRKAGWQLSRKVPAVQQALGRDMKLMAALGLMTSQPKVTAWIVDTSIEWNHQMFRGFLKISLEEVLIALRDEKRLLNDPDRLFAEHVGHIQRPEKDAEPGKEDTLYPAGFSTGRFIEVIETTAVWAGSL